ncbi:MAG TPA: hypothetical protein EYG57_11215, partial [Planctomycetes bacterium]|nr:hypothetical protein [Planctomycetota bacterium]
MQEFSIVIRVAIVVLLSTSWVHAQPEDIRDLKLRDWQPKSMLKTKRTQIHKPKFPVIDVHNHLGGGSQTLTPK